LPPFRMRRQSLQTTSEVAVTVQQRGLVAIILRVATLDDDPGSRPVAHIWTSHEVPWLSYADELPAYTEWPPGRSS
jgi:ADP-ribosyl-[dinitrogen reductase] hydrolase